MALGIMLAVVVRAGGVADAAARRAGQARPARSTRSRCRGRTPRAPLADASPPGPSASGAGRSPIGVAGPGRGRRAGLAGRAARHRHAVDHGRARRTTARGRATTRSRPRSARARPARCRSSRRAADARRSTRPSQADPGIASVLPAQRGRRLGAGAGVPSGEPSGESRRARRSSACAASCPPARSSAARSPRTSTSKQALADATPLVIGVVLALGFLLLLVALQAPVIALRRRAAQRVRDSARRSAWPSGSSRTASAPACSASSRRATSNAWAPVFFFAMLFALGWTTRSSCSPRPRSTGTAAATRGRRRSRASRTSGKVITAAAAVMVAVFFTFALSGPLPPKEMGVILGIAVLHRRRARAAAC